jgi:hypothetical protein
MRAKPSVSAWFSKAYAFARMAKRAGYQVVGLPNYVVWHIDTDEKPGNLGDLDEDVDTTNSVKLHLIVLVVPPVAHADQVGAASVEPSRDRRFRPHGQASWLPGGWTAQLRGVAH